MDNFERLLSFCLKQKLGLTFKLWGDNLFYLRIYRPWNGKSGEGTVDLFVEEGTDRNAIIFNALGHLTLWEDKLHG